MALATLSIDIEAKLASLQQGMDQASRAVQASTRKMEASFDGLRNAGALVGGVITGAFAAIGAVGVTRLVLGINSGIDALNDFKDATGASIENASALEDAAARTGTSFDTVQAAVLKLNKVLSDAKPGSEQANTLKAIGLGAEELKRLDPADALLKVSLALRNYEDDANKARIVQVLFGRSVAEVAPLLNDLADKGRLVATVTAEQALEAEKFSKNLAELEKTSLDVGRALVGTLVPALNGMLKAFNDAGGGVKGFRKALDDLGERTPFNQAFFDTRNLTRLRTELKALQDQQAAGPGLLDNVFGGGAKALDEKVAAKQFELNTLLRTLGERNTVESRGFAATAASFGGGTRPTLGDVPTATPTAKTPRVSELDKYIERLEAAQIAALDLSEVEKVQLDIASGKYKGLTGSVAEYALELARSIELLKQQADLPGPQIDAGELKRRNDAEKELQRILGESDLGKLQGILDLEANLAEARAEGRISAEQLAAALEVLEKQYDDLSPAAEKAFEQIDEFAAQAARNIQDFLGDSLVEILDGNFDDIGDNWESLLKRMVAQAAAAQLNKYLFGDQFGTTGQIGGLFGSIGSGSSGGGTISGDISPGGSDFTGQGIVDNGRATAQGVKADGGSRVIVNIQGAPSEPTVQQRTNGNGDLEVNVLFEQFRGRLMNDAQQGGPYISTVASVLGTGKSGALVR